MTSQRIHADKVAVLLKAKGLTVEAIGDDILCGLRVNGRPFSFPPYAAYTYDPSETANGIAERVAA